MNRYTVVVSRADSPAPTGDGTRGIGLDISKLGLRVGVTYIITVDHRGIHVRTAPKGATP